MVTQKTLKTKNILFLVVPIIGKNQNTVVVINNNSQKFCMQQGRIFRDAFHIDFPKKYSEISRIKSVMSLDIAEVKFFEEVLSKMDQVSFFKLLPNYVDRFAKNMSELAK